MSTDSSMPPVIEITDMTKTYVMGKTKVHALRGLSLTIETGEYVAIIGASGSGKSTLMNMIGLLDHPTSGAYRIRGRETSKLRDNEMADMRNAEIGFVAGAQLGERGGSAWIVDPSLYDPIRQDAVLLTHGADNPAAVAFLEFLKTPKAREIVESYGYAVEP